MPQIIMTPPGNVKISHWTHAGGFLSGLCMAYLFLPNLKDNRWQQVRALVGLRAKEMLFLNKLDLDSRL